MADSIGIRSRTILVAMPIILVAAVHPRLRLAFDVLATFLAIMGLREFYALARNKSVNPGSPLGEIICFGMFYAAHLGSVSGIMSVLTAGVLCGCVLFLFMTKQEAILSLSATFFGLLYVAGLGSHVVLVRGLPEKGAGYLLTLLACVWMGDIGAYLVGTGWGRLRILPKISPKKSLEGFIGGLAFSVLAAAILSESARFGLELMPQFSLKTYTLLGAALCMVSQLGDLLESYLKRDAEVKDSGSFFPGHGGILDRIDGLIFAAPLMYYFALLTKGR